MTLCGIGSLASLVQVENTRAVNRLLTTLEMIGVPEMRQPSINKKFKRDMAVELTGFVVRVEKGRSRVVQFLQSQSPATCI